MHGGPPPPGTTPTCDSAGILSPIINVIASLQAMEVIKIVSGNHDKISRALQIFDLWDNQIRQIKLTQLREARVSNLSTHQFDWLTENMVVNRLSFVVETPSCHSLVSQNQSGTPC